MILDFSSNDTLYTKSLVNDAEEDSVQPQKWQKGELGGADAGRVYAEGLRPQRCAETPHCHDHEKKLQKVTHSQPAEAHATITFWVGNLQFRRSILLSIIM